jgi:hypothetical protein
MSSTTEQKKELVEGIRDYLLRNETYTFRPTKIDGHNVYIVIYHKFKVVNIESIFVQSLELLIEVKFAFKRTVIFFAESSCCLKRSPNLNGNGLNCQNFKSRIYAYATRKFNCETRNKHLL